MLRRQLCALSTLLILVGSGNLRAAPSVDERTPNFVVRAPSSEAARAVAAEAERQRKLLGERWLGAEPTPWAKPCEIRVTLVPGPSGGATSFAFAEEGNRGGVVGARMDLRGELRQLLDSVLPHELGHVVLMYHFGKPLPRWADEGSAILAESVVDQAAHDARCRDVMNEGRAIRLRVLVRMMDYPRDLMAVYTQGHSLVRFLAGPVVRGESGGFIARVLQRARVDRFLAFLRVGLAGNTAESWDSAAKDTYGYESMDALEEAWVAWLKKPESVLAAGASSRSATPLSKPVTGDMIPPISLPGSGQRIIPPDQRIP